MRAQSPLGGGATVVRGLDRYAAVAAGVGRERGEGGRGTVQLPSSFLHEAASPPPLPAAAVLIARIPPLPPRRLRSSSRIRDVFFVFFVMEATCAAAVCTMYKGGREGR